MIEPYRLIIAPQAATDLVAIHDYIAKNSPENAVRMVTGILDALERLQDVPHRTVFPSQQRGLRNPVRSVTVRPFIVFFRALDDDKVIRILHIRHGARRTPHRFE